MKPTTGPAVKLVLATALAALLLALVGCAEGGQGTSTATSGSPATATTGQSGGGSGDCQGNYEVSSITGQQTVDLEGQELTLSGDVTGLEFMMDETKWELYGQNAEATASVAGIAAIEAIINGIAGGTYAASGDQYEFALEETSGSTTITLQGVGEQRIDMREFASVLAPVGQATMTCTSDGATIESESVKLELRRAAGGGSGTSGAPTTTS